MSKKQYTTVRKETWRLETIKQSLKVCGMNVLHSTTFRDVHVESWTYYNFNKIKRPWNFSWDSTIYTSVRRQILLMDPLPTVNKAYSLVLQEEKQCEITNGDRPARTLREASTFAARNNICRPERSYNPKNQNLKCGKCDKIGHTSDTCRAHLKCDHRGIHGHTVDFCRKQHLQMGV